MARKFTFATSLPQAYYSASAAASPRQTPAPKPEPVRTPEEQASWDEGARLIAARKARRAASGRRY